MRLTTSCTSTIKLVETETNKQTQKGNKRTITLAAQSKSYKVLGRQNTGIADSNPSRGSGVYPRLSLQVRAFIMGVSPAKEILRNVWKVPYFLRLILNLNRPENVTRNKKDKWSGQQLHTEYYFTHRQLALHQLPRQKDTRFTPQETRNKQGLCVEWLNKAGKANTMNEETEKLTGRPRHRRKDNIKNSSLAFY